MPGRNLAALLCLVGFGFGGSVVAAPWLTFTEIRYRPIAGDDPEFIEIYNIEAPRVELGGWKLEGQVEFDFPPGVEIAPRQCLVVAGDVDAFRERYPGVENVVGPFVGSLDDGGGRLNLRNRVGALAAAMRYGRDGAWSAVADGTGYTLVLADALLDPQDPRSWQPGPHPGGSPGVFEQAFERVAADLFLERGEEWKFFRGTRAPPDDWFAPALDDSGWESGRSGFGYADGDDETRLDDMRGSYLAVFTRKTFSVEDPAALGLIALRVDYDDGFVAYLNGAEVARENLGAPGEAVVWNQPARGSREAGSSRSFSLGPAQSVLRQGQNVLAVAVFNSDLGSSDLSLIVELEKRPVVERQEERSRAVARLNEVAWGAGERERTVEWIEFYNPGSERLDLGGHFLSDEPGRLAKWRVPPETFLGSEGFAVVRAEDLGLGPRLGAVLFLTAADGERVIDALSLRPASDSQSDGTLAVGRHPDGDGTCRQLARATAGAANEFIAPHDVVIHEINYHSPEGDPAGEYIELHNRGSRALSLEGLRLAGGVRYAFGAGDRIDPGGFLVVAREPPDLAKRYDLAPAAVVGPFEGSLANGGETIRLLDASGRTVDSVSFADRAPWPERADGWGSSLELIDPEVDNALAAAWEASDERPKGAWETVEYRGKVRLFRDMPASSLQFLLLDAGECFIDDVRVVDRAGRPVVEEDFEDARVRWRAFGTHVESAVVRQSPLAGISCYRVVSTGRGNSRHNYVSLDLDPELEENEEYSVSFRVRWLGGSRLLLSRTSGQGLARTHRLAIPERPGTPGRPNSRTAASPPVIGTPVQQPIAPRPDEPVRLRLPISARAPIALVEVRYRHASAPAWGSAPLQRRAGTDWTGVLPPLPRGRVEFFIVARDEDGREGIFPRGGADRPAQYAVGLVVEPEFPTYTVLVADREWAALRDRQRMSNRLLDATLVYGTSRIFYNVGFRPRGSGFTRGSGNWRIVLGAETLDGRDELTFDGQRGMGASKLTERATFWLLDQIDVPTPRQRFVHVNFHGNDAESGLYEDVEKVNGDFLARWFPRREGDANARGYLHKVDDYWDFRPPSASPPEADDPRGRPGRPGRGGFGGGFRRFGRRDGNFVEAYLAYESSDPERYRWNFPPRANGRDEDFGPLMELIELMDPERTGLASFAKRVEDLVDVDQWARMLAGRTLANDWDAYGLSRGKNAYLYRAASGRWHLLPWDSDLSWAGQRGFGGFGGFGRSTSIFPEKFPAVRRLLEQPPYRRRFLSTLAFLATKRLDPKTFGAVVRDLEEHVGFSARQLIDAAEANRRRILGEIPSVSFRVDRVERLSRDGRSDLLRLGGAAPLIVDRFRLDGRDGASRFPDERTWIAEFEVDPESSEFTLEAIDRDGDRVASHRVSAARQAAAVADE